jgi:hypothetical protein
VLVIERQIFHRARLCIGANDGIWDGGYQDVWDYSRPETALAAMKTWLTEETSEPQGWIRHYGTGRYRINGDKALEWVKDDDRLSPEHNIIYAVRAKLGYILPDVSIQESSLHIGSEMPAHTQCFTVTSKGAVQWIVYRYCHRNVVLSVDEIETTSVGNVIKRLEGGDE